MSRFRSAETTGRVFPATAAMRSAGALNPVALPSAFSESPTARTQRRAFVASPGPAELRPIAGRGRFGVHADRDREEAERERAAKPPERSVHDQPREGLWSSAPKHVLEPAHGLSAPQNADDPLLRQDHFEGAVDRLLVGLGAQGAARLVDLALVELQVLVTDRYVHTAAIREHPLQAVLRLPP